MSHTRINGRVIRALVSMSAIVSMARATPAYFATVANQALRFQGRARLIEGGRDPDVRAITELERQVKRVMGADPASELNVSALRDKPDPELLRILLLALLGNFTTAAGGAWNRPCDLVVDPENGRVVLQNAPPLESLALKVVLVLLVAVQIRQWVSESIAARATHPEPDHSATQRKGV